jgi:hypothetical protein
MFTMTLGCPAVEGPVPARVASQPLRWIYGPENAGGARFPLSNTPGVQGLYLVNVPVSSASPPGLAMQHAGQTSNTITVAIR